MKVKVIAISRRGSAKVVTVKGPKGQRQVDRREVLPVDGVTPSGKHYNTGYGSGVWGQQIEATGNRFGEASRLFRTEWTGGKRPTYDRLPGKSGRKNK